VDSRRLLAMVLSLTVLVSSVPLRPAMAAPQYYTVYLNIKGAGLIDPIEDPFLLEDGADWTVKVLFYNGEVWDAKTIDGPHNNDYPDFYATVDWVVDLSRFQNVTFEIQLWERDGWGLLPPDIADISAYLGGGYDDYNGSFPRGAMYVGYYNLVNNSLTGDTVQYLGNHVIYGSYYRTSGNFDGSLSVDENDADLWFYIKDDYNGSPTRRVPENYSTIQAAIDAAIPGANETIIVHPGTYYERITISKSNIEVIGLTGAIIDGSNGGGGPGNVYNVVFITGDHVTFSNFQVQGGTEIGTHGIGVFGNYSIVTGNTMTGNSIGVYTGASDSFFCVNTITGSFDSGAYALQCFNNTVSGNQISNNQGYGIYIYGSPIVEGVPNLIKGNTIANNGLTGLRVESSTSNYIQGNYIQGNEEGLYLLESGNNILRNNTMESNRYNFGIQGFNDSMQDYLQDIDNTSLVDGKPIYYWVNRTSGQIPEDAGYVGIVNSANIKVQDLEIMNNSQGVLLAFSKNLAVSNVTLAGNKWGMQLFFSNSSFIYHNNFENSTKQASTFASLNNTWDDGYPSGGNCWSDYSSTDVFSGPFQNETGSDGIGDTAYIIDSNNRDNYPLMIPWTGIHDIAVSNVTVFNDTVKQGEPIIINVTVENQGDNIEIFDVTVYANAAAVATLRNLTLLAHNSTTVNCTWNTVYFASGTYNVSVYAWRVPGETSTADNTFTDGTVQIAPNYPAPGGGSRKYVW